MRPISPEDLENILDLRFGCDELDERALRARQSIVASMGWYAGEIERLVGFLRVMPASFSGRFFDLDADDAVLAVVIGALDQFESVIDAIAWPVDDPSMMATFAGCASMLGHERSSASVALPVYRTALSWLRAGGRGVVPIHSARAARQFIEWDRAKLIAEDDQHGRDLAAARAQLVDQAPPILVVEAARTAA